MILINDKCSTIFSVIFNLEFKTQILSVSGMQYLVMVGETRWSYGSAPAL